MAADDSASIAGHEDDGSTVGAKTIALRLQPVARGVITAVLMLISLVALMQVARWQSFSIVQTGLSAHGKEIEAVDLPLKKGMHGIFRVRAEIELGSRASRIVRIVPDDRLLSMQLNGETVELGDFSPADLGSDWLGFAIELDTLVPNEVNVLELVLRNDRGPGGVDIRSDPDLDWTSGIVIFLSLVLLVAALSRHLRLNALQYAVLALAVLVSLAYLAETNSYTRTFDVYMGGGHRDYIQYLIEHRRLPHPGTGWEYHQPPLYFAVAALTKAGLVGTRNHGDFWAQLLALYFWTIFLTASLATLRLAFRTSRLALAFASLALCLWPAGIIHGIRIGNDVPLYAFYSLAFFYTLRWWAGRRFRYLIWGGVWAGAALLTKTSALAVWAVLGILLLAHASRAWRQRRENPRQLRLAGQGVLLLGLLFASAAMLNLGNNLWHYWQGDTRHWLLANVASTINPHLGVGNAPVNFLVFDLKTYLLEPFISTWDDRYGRQYFWNFLWRSALTSEFFFDDAHRRWAIINGMLLLGVLAGVVIHAIQNQVLMTRTQVVSAGYRCLPWLLGLLFPILALLTFRISSPYSCHADFRLIYPVLLALLFFSSRAWVFFPGRSWIWVPALGAPLIALASLVWVWRLGG